MAWSMPSGHGWNPGIGMAPDMNMGTYSPEQWALMQQQNWHQWTQWQQQFACWQNQYGEEYAQQMRIQNMSAVPPLPSGAVPPPVPPPDKPPPPPPPHENDQPLYGRTEVQDTPVTATTKSNPSTQPGYNNGNPTTGNNQNWSYSTDSHTGKQSAQGVNTEALRVLAEEEKLFDIQFKKWEEEIEKWKSENVNHPDRQAYSEYEQKFETCRAQLLERRQQMKKRRADLMDNSLPAPNTTNTGNNLAKAAPLQLNKTVPKYTTNIPPNDQSNVQLHVHSNNNIQNYSHKNPPQCQQFKNATQHDFTRNDNKTIDQQDRYDYNEAQHGYMRTDSPTIAAQDRYDNVTQQGYMRTDNRTITPQDSYDNNGAQQGYKRTDNKTIAPQDRYDNKSATQGYMRVENKTVVPQIDKNAAQQGYMRNNSNKIITPQDRYDNGATKQGYMGHMNKTVDPQDRYNNTVIQQDYRRSDNKSIDPQDRFDSYEDFDDDYSSAPVVNSTFLPTSKSSKDIPGLDLVPEAEKVTKQDIIDITDDKTNTHTKQPAPVAPDYSKISKGIDSILGDEKIMNILSMVSSQKPPSNNDSAQTGSYGQGVNVIPPKQWDANNTNYYINNYNYQQQSVPYKPQNMNNNQNSQKDCIQPADQRYDRNYDNSSINRPVNIQQEQYGRQNQFGNPNVPPGGAMPSPVRSNVAPTKLLLQSVSPHQQNSDHYYQDGFERNEIQSNFKPMNQPTKPKWIDDPLFTPSIIVEYDHKPLRLKAREFIEPVHTFDYNHRSKDSDNNSKKDFEKEADELFSRKPRIADVQNDNWNSERYQRDYERRLPRDDFKERLRMGQTRDGHDLFDRRVDNRRYDEYDRFRRQEFDRRDRGFDTERTRDFGYPREKDLAAEKEPDRHFSRDMERERELGRERDLRRDRDVGRDRDLVRDRDNGCSRDFGRDRDITRERDHGRDRILVRDPIRDRIMDRRDSSNRSHSRDRDSRKRENSRENDPNETFVSKKPKDSKDFTSVAKPTHIVMIDDLLEAPGRDMRPQKIVIILRGIPGSGKSYLAKLIRDKEAERGVTVRIMSIDDYFMQENEIEEKDLTTGKIIKKPSLKYEYDGKLEETYIISLKRAFKRSITDGYFSFLIYDAVNDQLKCYADIWSFARQNGFQVYISTMDLDPQTCFKRNIHNRSFEDIEMLASRFFPTPAHHIQLDATTLLQSASIREVQMEDVEDVTMEDADVVEVDSSFTSKWEKMDDAAQLARLDGTSRPLRPSQLSMEDYLQLDEWKPNVAKPGRKTVRWADLEERRQQEKMRAIGFVVGQTDWNRMTDPTMGSSALTQTKYIERVRRF